MYKPYVQFDSSVLEIYSAAQVAASSNVYDALPEWAQKALASGGAKAKTAALTVLYAFELEDAREGVMGSDYLTFAPAWAQETLQQQLPERSSARQRHQLASALNALERVIARIERDLAWADQERDKRRLGHQALRR